MSDWSLIDAAEAMHSRVLAALEELPLWAEKMSGLLRRDYLGQVAALRRIAERHAPAGCG